MEDFDEVVKEIATAISPAALEAIRIKVLGRRGSLTLAMRELGKLDPEERRRAGAALNSPRIEITAALAEATARLGRAALEEQLAGKSAPMSPCRCRSPERGASTRSARRSTRSSRSLARWASRSPKGRISRKISTTSPPSTFRPSTRRARSTTRSTCRSGRTARGSCCAPTPRRCRSARCWRKSRRSGSSCPGGPSAATTTRRTRRCFIRSRGWSSTGRPIWAI